MASPETPKRLQPLPETIRRLFLTSGNLCAFPQCPELMITPTGVFVGNICHIEAAEPGGPRFNSNMTNEGRRAYGNLMLMCYKHHKITDDVQTFTVEKLREMKSEHESKFADPVPAIRRALKDETTSAELVRAKHLARMNDALGWKLAPEWLQETAAEINEMADRLKRVPKNARTLIRILLERVMAVNPNDETPMLPFSELVLSCNLPAEQLSQLVRILERHSLVSVWPDDTADPYVELRPPRSRWPFWRDLAQFSRVTSVDLGALIEDLRFSELD